MKKVNVGIIGLGRLGEQHAINLACNIPNADLIAVCDMDDVKRDAFAGKYNIKYSCKTFEDLLAVEGLDAVFVVSPSGMHTGQITKALDAGKHVFSEKPLGVTVEECLEAQKAVERHPELVFMLGFMRRFDDSYKYAHDMVMRGEIGDPILFRSYSQDPEKNIAGAIAFAAHSGGEFLDMAVHDIDLARWFLQSEPKTVYAIGGCYAHPEFAKYNDGDNVSCLMQFENDAMCFIFAGRTAPHGYNVETEIIGTKGILRIANVPQKNMVEILDNYGVRKECSQNFLERFEKSYLSEANEFISCIFENRKPEITVNDGTQVSRIAYRCKESFETGTLLAF